MRADLDTGPGDVSRFSVEDLERLFRLGVDPNPAAWIRGDQLNFVLSVTRYRCKRWYLVTPQGVQLL